MRAQTATLYKDYAEREKQWNEREKASKEEGETLREERDALAVKTKRLEEVLNVEEQAVDDPAAPHRFGIHTGRVFCFSRFKAFSSTCTE